LVEVIRFGDEVGQKQFRAITEQQVFQLSRFCRLLAELVKVNDPFDADIKNAAGWRFVAVKADEGSAVSFQVAATWPTLLIKRWKSP